MGWSTHPDEKERKRVHHPFTQRHRSKEVSLTLQVRRLEKKEIAVEGVYRKPS